MRALAIAYAIGVMLVAPVTLHAADPAQMQPAPAEPPAEPAAGQVAPAPPAAQAQAPEPAAPAPAAPEPEPKAQPEPEKPAPIAVKAAPGSVRMLDFSFSPATITVNVGESVTWVNAGEQPHNAVGDNFSTALLDPGKSGSKSFGSAGTFSYLCTVHPQMKGTVKVVGASTSQGQTGSEDSGTEEDDSDVASDPGEDDGPQLASSGLDAWVLGLAGVALLAAGMTLRRRTA